MNIEEIPDKIVESAIDENLASIAIDVSELGLDQLLDESFLKDLPVVGIFIKSLKSVLNIKDRLLMAKIIKFLVALNSTSEEDRAVFGEKIKKDKKFKSKVGGTLFLILDRLDDIDKPAMVAKAFEAYLGRKISFADFRRIAAAIDIAFIDDLLLLVESSRKQSYFSHHGETLLRSGLYRVTVDVDVDIETRIGKSTANTISRVEYELTDLGVLFLNVMKNDWPSKK